jgi:hypothetical protein
LQNNYIQNKLINILTGGDIEVRLIGTHGIFPFSFSIDRVDIRFKSQQTAKMHSSVIVRNVSILLSKKLTHIRRMTIDEMDIRSNGNGGLNLSDIHDVLPMMCQKIIKRISIEKLTFNNKKAENISFSLDNALQMRALRFRMNNEDYEAQLKIHNSNLILNVTSTKAISDTRPLLKPSESELGAGKFRERSIECMYGILDRHVSLKLRYKSNDILFDGMYTNNSLSGILQLQGSIDQKLSCNLMLNNGVAEAAVYSSDIGLSSHLVFNIAEELLLVKDTRFDNDIKVESFFVRDDHPIPSVNVLLKRGTISIKNLNLFSESVELGKIEVKDVEIAEILGAEILNGGKLNGTGTYQDGTIKLDLKAMDCQFGQVKVPVLDIVAQCRNDNAKIQIRYDFLKKQSFIECQIAANNWIPSKTSGIKLRATGEFRIQDYVTTVKQSASGVLKYDLSANGTVIGPIFSGEIKLKDGVYMNPSTNTYIKNGSISAVIRNNDLVIDKISVTDDGKPRGTISGSGKISLKKNLDTDITLELHDFNVVEINDFYGKVNGRISIKGDLLTSVKISGEVYSDQAKLNVANLVMKTSRSIEIVQGNKGSIKRESVPHQIKAPLDIKFVFKNGMKIQGSGMDSIWEGGASLYGDLFDPKYNAKLTMKKGSIRVSGKDFNLKDGVIWIDSTKFDTFHICITAVKKLDDIKVGAKFTQDENGVKVTVFSKPYASRIDILSYLLFGKRSAEISAGEAFTLFSIMSKLTDGDRLDILDKLKSVLGLDDLEIKKNTDANMGEYSAVSIGKRIGSVKISVDQGAGKDTTKVVLEKKVAKNTKISVDLSGKNSVGAGIAWSRRY